MPALGEIFKTAIVTRTTRKVSSSVKVALLDMQDSIYNQIQQIDGDKMHDIWASVEKLRENCDNIIATKKKYDPGWPNTKIPELPLSLFDIHID